MKQRRYPAVEFEIIMLLERGPISHPMLFLSLRQFSVQEQIAAIDRLKKVGVIESRPKHVLALTTTTTTTHTPISQNGR